MPIKISMLLPVYNEEALLFYSLESTIPYVHQAVIIDGSPWGPSTDQTREIVNFFDKQYPGKIEYLSGAFALPDGGWDEGSQRSLGLSQINGDILMPHCGDMIYTDVGMKMMIEAIERSPERKIVYCPFIEFWLNTNFIRLYGGYAMESGFVAPAISDINFVSLDIVSHYEGGPHLVLKRFEQTDFMYIPYAFRYHYGWLGGFKLQVEKQFRRMKMGAWKESSQDVSHLGDAAITRWAINHLLDYPNMGCAFPYWGEIPVSDYPNWDDGKEDAIQYYESTYGKDFWK